MSEQRFPNGKRWVVDVDAVLRLRPTLDRARLEHEITEMAQHFGRWVLSVARGAVLARCEACDGVLVFDRGLRCVACDRPANARGLQPAWFGLLPPIGLDGLSRIKDSLLSKPPPGHVVGTHAQIGNYILVPLVVVLPDTFPQTPVQVHYMPTIRKIAGMPSEEVSHAFHMLPNQQMCLFAGGEWSPSMTARETLQQRAFAHVIKLLNYANGKYNAFAIVS